MMGTITRFEDIVSWREARELNKIIGALISSKRFSNNFALIDQIERSAGSIMDNIAEGFERGGNKEFKQFLYIAKASCAELRSQLYRAVDRNYINEDEFDKIVAHAMRVTSLIQAFINYIEKSEIKGIKFKEKDSM